MHDTPKLRLGVKNKILSVLPDREFELLVSNLEQAVLAPGKMIYQAGDTIKHLYFPNRGMISLLSVTEQGQAVEVGFTGFEGVIGIAALIGNNEMPYQALTQSEVDCLRVDAPTAVKLFNQGGVFHDIVLRYLAVVVKQLAQTCICNNMHKIEARLCRWLTIMVDRSGNRHLRLTQEFLAHMLGVQRTSIGMIANSMQAKGIIKYKRGKIEIVDYEKMRDSACECYRLIKNEQRKFLDDEKFPVMSGI